MILRLFLASLTIACVTYTLQSSLIFDPIRRWIMVRLGVTAQQTPFGVQWVGSTPIRQWALQGLQCGYCFAHWVGLVTVPLVARDWREAALILFPAIWLSTVVSALTTLVGNLSNFLSAQVSQARDRSRPAA